MSDESMIWTCAPSSSMHARSLTENDRMIVASPGSQPAGESHRAAYLVRLPWPAGQSSWQKIMIEVNSAAGDQESADLHATAMWSSGMLSLTGQRWESTGRPGCRIGSLQILALS